MIEEIILKAILKQAMRFLLKRFAFLNWGPIPAIMAFFLERILRMFIKQTVLGLNFLYIDIKTERQLREYNKRMDEIEEMLITAEENDDFDPEKFDEMVRDAAIDFYRIV